MSHSLSFRDNLDSLIKALPSWDVQFKSAEVGALKSLDTAMISMCFAIEDSFKTIPQYHKNRLSKEYTNLMGSLINAETAFKMGKEKIISIANSVKTLAESLFMSEEEQKMQKPTALIIAPKPTYPLSKGNLPWYVATSSLPTTSWDLNLKCCPSGELDPNIAFPLLSLPKKINASAEAPWLQYWSMKGIEGARRGLFGVEIGEFLKNEFPSTLIQEREKLVLRLGFLSWFKESAKIDELPEYLTRDEEEVVAIVSVECLDKSNLILTSNKTNRFAYLQIEELILLRRNLSESFWDSYKLNSLDFEAKILCDALFNSPIIISNGQKKLSQCMIPELFLASATLEAPISKSLKALALSDWKLLVNEGAYYLASTLVLKSDEQNIFEFIDCAISAKQFAIAAHIVIKQKCRSKFFKIFSPEIVQRECSNLFQEIESCKVISLAHTYDCIISLVYMIEDIQVRDMQLLSICRQASNRHEFSEILQAFLDNVSLHERVPGLNVISLLHEVNLINELLKKSYYKTAFAMKEWTINSIEAIQLQALILVYLKTHKHMLALELIKRMPECPLKEKLMTFAKFSAILKCQKDLAARRVEYLHANLNGNNLDEAMKIFDYLPESLHDKYTERFVAYIFENNKVHLIIDGFQEITQKSPSYRLHFNTIALEGIRKIASTSNEIALESLLVSLTNIKSLEIRDNVLRFIADTLRDAGKPFFALKFIKQISRSLKQGKEIVRIQAMSSGEDPTCSDKYGEFISWINTIEHNNDLLLNLIHSFADKPSEIKNILIVLDNFILICQKMHDGVKIEVAIEEGESKEAIENRDDSFQNFSKIRKELNLSLERLRESLESLSCFEKPRAIFELKALIKFFLDAKRNYAV